jgi:hypothetical protein
MMVDADLSEKSFSKEITGLTPGTTYEYQAMDGEQVSSVTCEFTTETEFQPENAGFEYTSGSSPILIYGDKQSMWWDTGNHGSATMKKNVTTPDTSVKHSGNQSILLSSQFVGVEIFGNPVVNSLPEIFLRVSILRLTAQMVYWDGDALVQVVQRL